MLELAAYLLVGRLLTWLLMTNGLTRRIWHLKPILTELGECDLCLGFWVYLGLGIFNKKRPLINIWPKWIEIPIIAAVATFTIHLVRLGWQAKFGVVIDD